MGGIMAIRTDLEQFIGDDYSPVFQLDPVIDITGLPLSFIIGKTLNSVLVNPTPLIPYKTPVVLSGPGGACTTTVTSADSLALGIGKFWWGLRTTGTGAGATLGWGQWTVKPIAS
jgi:hypothetical protein